MCLQRYFCVILCMSFCSLSCVNSVGCASASVVTNFLLLYRNPLCPVNEFILKLWSKPRYGKCHLD